MESASRPIRTSRFHSRVWRDIHLNLVKRKEVLDVPAAQEGEALRHDKANATRFVIRVLRIILATLACCTSLQAQQSNATLEAGRLSAAIVVDVFHSPLEQEWVHREEFLDFVGGSYSDFLKDAGRIIATTPASIYSNEFVWVQDLLAVESIGDQRPATAGAVIETRDVWSQRRFDVLRIQPVVTEK